MNNDIARAAGLLAVAVLPGLAGITPKAYASPAALSTGFHHAVLISAALCAFGGLLSASSSARSSPRPSAAATRIRPRCSRTARSARPHAASVSNSPQPEDAPAASQSSKVIRPSRASRPGQQHVAGHRRVEDPARSGRGGRRARARRTSGGPCPPGRASRTGHVDPGAQRRAAAPPTPARRPRPRRPPVASAAALPARHRRARPTRRSSPRSRGTGSRARCSTAPARRRPGVPAPACRRSAAPVGRGRSPTIERTTWCATPARRLGLEQVSRRCAEELDDRRLVAGLRCYWRRRGRPRPSAPPSRPAPVVRSTPAARLIATGSCPSRANASTVKRPMRPVAPATATTHDPILPSVDPRAISDNISPQ